MTETIIWQSYQNLFHHSLADPHRSQQPQSKQRPLSQPQSSSSTSLFRQCFTRKFCMLVRLCTRERCRIVADSWAPFFMLGTFFSYWAPNHAPLSFKNKMVEITINKISIWRKFRQSVSFLVKTYFDPDSRKMNLST